jgi:hypothetical protein
VLLSFSLSNNFPGKVNRKENPERKEKSDLGFFPVQGEYVSDRKIDAQSRPAEHQNAQSHRAPENGPLHRRDSHHRRARYVLCVQHREQPMGSFLIFYFCSPFGC